VITTSQSQSHLGILHHRSLSEKTTTDLVSLQRQLLSSQQARQAAEARVQQLEAQIHDMENSSQGVYSRARALQEQYQALLLEHDACGPTIASLQVDGREYVVGV
jgi:TorA maturation chaperone TorD